MDPLTLQKCKPCEGGVLPFTKGDIEEHLKQLNGKWESENGKKIRHEFRFKTFKEAIVFVDTVAKIAEEEQHHPDIHIFYNRVVVELWTHAIMGLSVNDFIMAAKINEVLGLPPHLN